MNPIITKTTIANLHVAYYSWIPLPTVTTLLTNLFSLRSTAIGSSVNAMRGQPTKEIINSAYS